MKSIIRNIGKGLIVGFLLLSLISSAFAQSEIPARGRFWGIGARALGMGGAFSSVTDDYSATYWNPAGLAMMRRMEFLCSVPHLRYQNQATFKDNKSSSDENFTKLDAIGFAFPVPTYRGSLVFAFGYNRVQHFDEVFHFSWFNPTGDLDNPEHDEDLMTETWDELEKGHLGQYSVSGALDVSPNLSLGLSANLWRGNNSFEYSYEAKDDSAIWDLDIFGWDDIINSDLSAMNLKFGVLYRLGRLMHFAGTVDLPYTLKIKENSTRHEKWIWEDYDPVDEHQDFSFDYKIRTPFKFRAGASIYLPQLVLSGDVEFTDWSQMEYKTEPPFTKINPVAIGDTLVYLDSTMTEINQDIREKYRATTKIHLGAEFTVPFIYTQLRAGVFYEPSPLKGLGTEADRKYITLGAGLLLDKQMKLDFAWVHGWWKAEAARFSKDINPLLEEVKLNQLMVTLAMRF